MWAAIKTIKSRIGTWKGFAEYQRFDPSISREEWATTIGQARAALANRALEITRPLNRRPDGPAEITPFSTRGARGFLQQVVVYVRDRDTGVIEERHHSMKVDTLRSRQSVIDEVRGRFQSSIEGNPQDYPEDVLGVMYMGTHEMIPR